MNIEKFAQTLDNFTNPEHSHFVPGSLLIVSSLSFMGTTCVNLTGIISTTPIQGMLFTVLAFGVHQMASRLFAKAFKSIENDSLAPTAYRLLNWTVSLLSAKAVCAIFGVTVTLSQIAWIAVAFLITLRIAKTIVQKLLQSTSAPILSEIPMRKA